MKKLLALLLALCLALSLCACGSSAKNSAAEEAAEAPAMAVMDAKVNSNGLAMAGGSRLTAAEEADAAENSEKIIYSSDVTVESTDFDGSIAALAALVEDYGGYVQSSSINGADYYSSSRGYNPTRSASYTLRIPSARFNELMNSLSQLGNIPYSYTYTENVTAQYYDVQARLTAYTTQEARLLEMMELAETVSDIIAIEEKLTELRYEIESLQSTLNNWDRRVSYSTVNVNIQEVREYTPEANVSYARELLRSFVNGLKNVGNFFSNLLVNFVGALPALVLISAAVLICRPLLKKLRGKFKKHKKEE